MPVILATWEPEIGRIMVLGHPRQKKSSKDLISVEKHWMWWCTPDIPAIVRSPKQDCGSSWPGEK
jgi:hypothetical protein